MALLKEVAPEHPRLPDAEMAIHVQRREYEAAMNCVERMIANPPSPEEASIAQSRRADLLLTMERYEDAVTAYDALLAQRPRDPWKWHNKSIALMSLGRYDEALECNAQALSIMDFGVAHATRERILARQAEAASGVLPGSDDAHP